MFKVMIILPALRLYSVDDSVVLDSADNTLFDVIGATTRTENKALAAAVVERYNCHSTLVAALKSAWVELSALVDGNNCEHDLNICWCDQYNALRDIREALEAAGASGVTHPPQPKPTPAITT